MIRPAAVDDAERLAAIHVGSSKYAYSRILPASWLGKFTVDRRTEQYNGLLVNLAAGEQLLVAEADCIEGFIHLGPSRDDDVAGEGEIYTLYVDPDQWDCGVGTALLGAGEHQLASAGFRVATLWVLELNERAIAFYERRGWSRDEACKTHEADGREVVEVRYRSALKA